MDEVSILALSPNQTLIMNDSISDSMETKISWVKEAYGLTATEFKILQGLAAGQTPQQIAGQNNSAVATVRSHINSIYKKTRVNKVIGLMALMLNGPATMA